MTRIEHDDLHEEYRAFGAFGKEEEEYILHMDNPAIHKIQIEILRRMTPEQRLEQAFDLSEFTRALFRHGLRKQYPDLSEQEFQKLYLERMEKCHNRNY